MPWTNCSAYCWPKASAVSLDIDSLLLLTYDLQAFSTSCHCHCPHRHLSLNLSSAELPPLIPCFFYVPMQTKFHLCYVINLLVCWWFDRGRKRGMMKCCFQELLTDNLKISISVVFFLNHQESIFNLQRTHFTKTNIIKNTCWNIKFNQDRWRTVSY